MKKNGSKGSGSAGIKSAWDRMKVSHEEVLANHFGLQRRRGIGDDAALSVRAEGNVGQLLSSEILTFACRSYPVREKAKSRSPLLARWLMDAAGTGQGKGPGFR